MSKGAPKEVLKLRGPDSSLGKGARSSVRKRRRTRKLRQPNAQPNDGESGPLNWRMQHHPLGEDSPALTRTRIDDVQDDAPPSYPMRAADTIDALLKKGRIDDKAALGARKFEMMFQYASLNGYATRDIRVPPGAKGTGNGGISAPHNVHAARDGVWLAMCALGGIGTPGANIVWDVLGLGMTIKGHAERCQFGGGRSLNPMTATGILVQSCFTLAAFYQIEGNARL